MKTSIVSIKKLSTMYNIRPVKFMKGISKLQNFFECVQFFQIKIVNKNVQSNSIQEWNSEYFTFIMEMETKLSTSI